MLELKGVCTRYGPVQVLWDVSLKVEEGELVCLLGGNASGKSTTMKMLTGFLTPTSGTALINGIDVVENSVSARKNIGYLPEAVRNYLALLGWGYDAETTFFTTEDLIENQLRLAGENYIEARRNYALSFQRSVNVRSATCSSPMASIASTIRPIW